MHRSFRLLAAGLLLLTTACTQSLKENSESVRTPVVEKEDVSVFIPGSVIVQFDEEVAEQLLLAGSGTKPETLGDALDGMGVKSIERLFPDAGRWEARHRKAGLHRWYRLTYDPSSRPVTKASEDFSNIPGVISSEPERRIRTTSYFNDPKSASQWALYNDGTRGSNYKAGCDINVVPVWDNYTAGSPDVIVAVLDLGVQLDHPDLAANCIPGGPDGSKSFIDGHSGYDIPADNHGTHVAGIIAAVNNNGIGISGIAGGRDGKGVRILSCPFMMSNPDNPEQTIQGDSYNAMVWAADHGAVIAQNSWGYVYETEDQAQKGGVGYMAPAIDYFIEYAGCDEDGNQLPDSPMKGGVVIFAAGNESWSMGWPAAYEPVIAVGATTAQFNRAGYSNYGDWVDICAPGGDASKGALILSTIAGGDYDSYQGTSMACPQVSGVAALIVSHFGGQGFTNDMLKERLLGGSSATKVSKNLLIGPMVDALGSFTYNGTVPPEAPEGVSTVPSSNTIEVSWKVTPDPDDVKTYGYMLLASKDPSLLEDVEPRMIPESVISVSVEVGTVPVGDTISTTLSDLEFDTPYYLAVFAYDYRGHYSEQSAIVSARTGKNNPPVITTDYTGGFQIKPFEKISLDYTVSDPDGHGFTVEVNPGSDAFTFNKSKDVIQVEIAGNRAPQGKYVAHIVATDSYGAQTDCLVEYEILENHAPIVISGMDDMVFGSTGENFTFDLPQYVKDDDNEPLSYKVNMTEQNVVHVNASGNSLVLTTLGFGLTTVTVTALDACNASCSFSFRVLIRDNSRPYDVYPNPVKDVLYIRPGETKTANLSVSNKAGAVVFSQEGTTLDPFAPVAINMKKQPGGVYYLKIDTDYYTIVKQ